MVVEVLLSHLVTTPDSADTSSQEGEEGKEEKSEEGGAPDAPLVTDPAILKVCVNMSTHHVDVLMLSSRVPQICVFCWRWNHR